MVQFDIIIPTTDKDLPTLEKCIEGAKKFIVGARNIYVISKEKYTDNAIWFDENNFPFNLEIIKSVLDDHYRSGWYYQQLIKFYALFTIPNITDNIMCLDSDTIFLKKTDFFKNGKPYYNYGSANHRPYFKHMKKLLPELERQEKKKSGITHHMIFNIKILRELFYKIESNHKAEFWLKFLELVDRNEKSGASEYEIYFNYCLKNYNDDIILRKLKWDNCKTHQIKENLHYYSYHSYLRK
jgi:hypothetical protein